jgi:uncharacterized membrane protein YgcG
VWTVLFWRICDGWRKVVTKLIGLVVLFTGSLLAVDCNSVVSNDAGVALGDTTALIRAANDVAAKGAEPHVLIEALRPGETLDTKFAQAVSACSEWQAPGSKTKSTLIVFALAPTARKSGIFYGSAWHHALDDSWNRIKTDYMNPRFRDRDWAGGLAAAAEQTAKRITASEDEAVHGPTTIVNHQATDLSGIWLFLKWLLILGGGAAAVIVGIILFRQKKEDAAEVQAAQADAIAARNKATDALNDARRKVPVYVAAGGKNAVSVQAWLATAMERYQTVSDSVSNDPDQKGLTADVYQRLSKQYSGVFQALDKVVSLLADEPEDKPRPAAPSIPISDFRSSTRGKRYRRSEAPTQPAPAYAPAAAPIIVNNSNDGFVEGLVLGELASDRRETVYEAPRYEPAPYRAPDPDPPSSYGGSSSWDSPSSSSDDGGSSSFDSSSSSDSGGGSADF